jgi:glycosyltransferase involved in cell wall biosynthesis
MGNRRVLALNAFYLPGYKGGGSIRALANLAGHLKNDFDFVVATGQRDFGETRAYPAQERREVIESEGYPVHYLSSGQALAAELRSLLREPWDLIYLNSTFSIGYSILPMLLRRFMGRIRIPVLLAPRGELMPGAMANGRLKTIKKRTFLQLARATGHFSGIHFHATSTDEAAFLQALKLGQADITMVPDLPPRAGTDLKLGPTKKQGRLRLVFVSRIDPKKNLDYALRVLAEVKAPVDFDIVGPVADEAHWANCRQVIATLPNHIRVRHLGSIPHDEILRTFAERDFFFFPTKAENNGYVILEALLAGCPVLLSDQTPWRGMETHGAGWDLSLDQPGTFRTMLEQLAALGPDQHLALRRSAQAYGRSRLSASADIAATRDMFRAVMN